ncbi:Methionine aminopeptidase [Plasmodium coatneyi]|uniref:Methionine aminopeptidase n=1 Tax=Plasmodium coatneyi TaxID=208452 RepID=A0A1B1DSU7_9APIC|nr:Methionine aminopeptidase [Plasmodium coatneyi]ANQ05814.1 Methionine aminopeptidase [Plasmodium coatneyi]
MKARTLVLLAWALLCMCRRGGSIGRVRCVKHVRRVSRAIRAIRGNCTGCGDVSPRKPRRGFIPVGKNSKGSYAKEGFPYRRHPQRNRLNHASAGEGFSNTIHHDVKKNTQNYEEDGPPASFHRYIENIKTRKIIHPSIRITDFDKKFMRCKESYNGRYSHLKDSELFGSFRFVGRQKKGIMSPKYYLPKYVERPNYHRTGTPVYVPYGGENQVADNTKGRKSPHPYSNVKSEEDIETIRSNCLFARELMDDVSHIICEGVTTNDIDIYLLNKCINNGYYPSPLNYHLFPKSSCISINEILCHGIPDNNVLYENDIVKVDISVFKDGFHADMCESFLVPKLSKNEKKKRKKFYDFIYLNDKLRTKHTKFILKYNFDLTTNKVVKTGKQCSIRRIRYDPPNSKDRPCEEYHSYDDNTNAVFPNGDFGGDAIQHATMQDGDYYNAANGPAHPSGNELQRDDLDELELFHRQYDEQVIYNKSQSSKTYDDLQRYIYSKTRGSQKDQSSRNRFAFFEKKKVDADEFKTYMRKKNIDLIRTAHECTMEAIRVCKAGAPFSAIGDAIANHLDKINNRHQVHYAVVPHLCGHNIGKNFHEEPFIIHTRNNDDRRMCENLVFTIEPIISERPCDFIMWPDNWTLSNARYVFSAQFEHTIVVRKDGAEILTGKTDGSPKFVWESEEM